MKLSTLFYSFRARHLTGSLAWLFVISIALVAAVPSLCEAQPYPQQNYQAQLNQNIAQQNNLKNNINFLMRLREQARGRAQLSRTAGDRGAYNYWADQYRQLQARINEFSSRLRQLEVREQDIRTAMHSPNRNLYQRSGQGGGKPMIPEFSAQNRVNAGGSNGGSAAGAYPGSPSSGNGGGGYVAPRTNNSGSVDLLDQSAFGR